jgi:hypothetical protein
MKINIGHDSDKPNLLYIDKPVELDLPHSGKTIISASPDSPFWWDGASNFRFLYGIIPPHKYPLQSLFHDYLCENAKTAEDRKNADLDFLWIGREIYKLKLRIQLGYLGVRLGSILPFLVKLVRKDR